ncbi:PI-PLC X domain-containing protein 3-like isoform X1 [Trichogramma pretiosum]|uniref:PI-PLC X domain-containing protein 3-like isoform X1 n=1 Tax=Trichogramma pretiosum TaxID=7493 RepID=UPI0006C989F8|nr:PI-PLC X domain-containing protein 3-like isoform X1 [Trichogramma pretiosum]
MSLLIAITVAINIWSLSCSTVSSGEGLKTPLLQVNDKITGAAAVYKMITKRNTQPIVNGTSNHDDLPILWENLEIWMSLLPESIRELPIIQLAIPGSHNSMTYTIDKNNDLGPDNPGLVNTVNLLFPNLTKTIAFNWAINQKVDVTQQLDGGVRFLDLRLATKKMDNKFYFVHGLYGGEIGPPLRQVADWLTKHPEEVVIMDFQHFYNFTEQHHRDLMYLIKDIFRGKMCPRFNAPGNVSLRWMNSRKYQVIIIYRHFVVAADDNFWLDRLWPTPWAETVSRTRLVHFLNGGLRNRDRSIGFISQSLLTPDHGYISRHFFGNLEKALGNKMQRLTLDWVNSNYPGDGGMNVVMTDFVSHTDFLFVKTVIQRNEKFLIA